MGVTCVTVRYTRSGRLDVTGSRESASIGRQLDRLSPGRHLLRVRARHRRHGPPLGLHEYRLLPLGSVAAGVGDRARLHLGQPRCGRDHGHVCQRCPVRHPDGALLLGRGRAGDAVPRRGDDAVLLRLEGALRPRVHAQAVRPRRPLGQRDQLRRRAAADRRHQPVPAREDRQHPSRLEPLHLTRHRRPDRALLHPPRRSVGGDLQRGPAVLRDRRGVAATDPGRPAQGGRVRRSQGQDHGGR